MSKELEAFRRLQNNIRLLEENTSLKYFFENDEFHFREDLDIIKIALKRLEELEKALRKNATREKAKMLDKYIKRFFIPEKRWRDVHYVIESNEKWASMYRDSLNDKPQN